MTYVTAFTVLESYYVRILSCFGACQSKIAKLFVPRLYSTTLSRISRGGGNSTKWIMHFAVSTQVMNVIDRISILISSSSDCCCTVSKNFRSSWVSVGELLKVAAKIVGTLLWSSDLAACQHGHTNYTLRSLYYNFTWTVHSISEWMLKTDQHLAKLRNTDKITGTGIRFCGLDWTNDSTKNSRYTSTQILCR